MNFRPVLASLFVAAAPIPVLAEPTRIGPTTSVETALGALMVEGCVPYLLDKTPLAQSFKGRGRAVKVRDQPGVMLPTAIPTGAIEQGAGCYVRVDKGNGAVYRAAVLAAVGKAADGPLRTISDGGPTDNDGRGRYRQEMHCFTLKGRAAGMVVSSSDDGSHAAIQVTALLDSNGPCAKP